MQFWNEIINTALLGTEKKPLPVAALPMPLQEAAKMITERAAATNVSAAADKEEQFLQLAALSFNFRQSGSKPLHLPALKLSEAAAESLPYCSPRAALVLKDILAEDNPSLLNFWLERCVANRQLVRPEFVHILFNRAANDRKHLQQNVATVCGRRGEWLRQFNPAWTTAIAANEEELWSTGTPDQRKIVLWRMRKQDPARTREWLLQTWPQENANTKAELLKQLDATVQPEDEPWLTDLLSEKSQKVKDEAFRLLKQLRSSALVKKYAELAKPLIVLKKGKALLGMLTKTTLHIQPPVLPEKGEYAPGIDQLSNDKAFSDGEFVLYQLIQNIPPDFWEEHFALPPAGILGLFSGNNEKYLPAFVKATVQFNDQKWAFAYLDYRDVFYAELLDLLPPQQQEAYCLRHFKQYPDGVIQHARNWHREWSLPLAKEIMGHTARQPFQYGVAFYKSGIQLIPVAIVNMLESFVPTDLVHQKISAHVLDQLKPVLVLKQQTINAFNE